MGFDEEYLDELLNSIEPIINPDGVRHEGDDDSVPDVAEEHLDSLVAEVEDMEEEADTSDVVELAVQEDIPEESVSIAEPEPEQAAEPVELDLDSAADAIPDKPVSETETESNDAMPDLTELLDYNPDEGNKILSADEISAMFATVNAATGDSVGTEEAPVEETPEPAEVDLNNTDDISALLEGLGDGNTGDVQSDTAGPDIDLGSLLAGSDEPVEVANSPDGDRVEEIDMGMSEAEIDAMLAAAKSAADADAEEIATDDILATLASAGDADLTDIQSILNSNDNNEAVDEAAFLEATAEVDEAGNALETPAERKKRLKAEKKAAKEEAKKNKKKNNKAPDVENPEEPADAGEKKPGFMSKLLTMLTESDDDLEEAAEAALAAVPEASETGITAENQEILAEIDSEEDGKKKKKKDKKEKKNKKDKKGKKGEKSEGEDEGDGEGEEDAPEDKKKKKPKKQKAPKVKEIEDEEVRKPKKLPKKRVIATFVLMLSLMAAILLAVYGLNKVINLQDARWAFDNQDYETAYTDLYGEELEGDDKAIFDKSETILLIDRKLTSYNNYRQLGMDEYALNALIEGVKEYPDVKEQATNLGVGPQVDNIYMQIVQNLGTYGLSEADAQEIAAYDSKVKYTRRIQSIVNGTPFTYDDGNSDVASNEQTEVTGDQGGADASVNPEDPATQSMDDILDEEKDFLPDDPNTVIE